METFEYAVENDSALLLDVYAAENGPSVDLGTVIYVHGGGFVEGDRAMDSGRLRAMAKQGLTVVSIDYRLAPSAYPDPVDDVRAAIRWVRSNRERLGGVSERVALWGSSAGAVLASLAALAPSDRADDRPVDAVVSWFGFSNIETSSSRSPLEAAILPAGPALALLGVDSVDARSHLVREASPIEHVTSSAPPFLIAHGDQDHVVDVSESRQMHQALTRVGAASSLLILGGAGHEDPRFDSASTIALTAGFLRSHLTSTDDQ